MSSKRQQISFAKWVYLDLFILSAVLTLAKPAVGLMGMGVVLVLTASQVLANQNLIWRDYVAHYQKSPSRLLNKLQEPKLVYYRINRYILWPIVFGLGLAAILTAAIIS